MQFGFGTGYLTGLRTDNADSVTNTPQRFGALQEVSVEFGGDTKELYATEQFPIDTARGKTKISGKAKVAAINARMYNELFFGQTLNTGQTKYALNELATLTNSTIAPTYTVSFAASTPLADQGVFNATTGLQFQQVSTAPGSGQYTWVASTGVYSFGTISNATPLYFNYTYKVTTGFQISGVNLPMGTTPRFSVTLFMQYPNNTTQVVLYLYQAVSNRLTFPTRLDDYWIQDLDFNAFADSAGRVFEWSTTQ